MIDTEIEIDRLALYCFHGVLPQERKVGNWFEVSLKLRCDIETAAVTDDLSRSVNYAEVIELVKVVMSKPVNLIEHAANNIITALNERFPAITGGYVKVTKLHPPCTAQVAGVSATLQWQR